MTTANKITILRILLVPFFVLQLLYYIQTGDEWNRFLAILSFVLAAVSDGVDGYIARRYNQRSELGAILDPLADKLLLVSGVVLLSLDNAPHFERIPLWLTGTIISRDLLLLIGLVVIQMISGKPVVRPRAVGKIATVFQMITVAWILLQWPGEWLEIWILGAALFTGGSGLLYVGDGIRQLSASPSSGPQSRMDGDVRK
jgi:CDP-diacylglycerol--glycerol-3-phosphate 3-phosphatidyltransferase